MDSILPYLTPYHNYCIALQSLFFVAGLTKYLPRHDPACTTKYQGFTQVVFIKNKGAINRGDTALVAPMFNPLPHTFKDSFRVE